MNEDPSSITPAPRAETHRAPTPRLFLGLLLIFIGVIFTLDRLHWIDAGEVFKFWPLVLVAAGAGKLFWPGSSSSWASGLLLIVIGGWLQLEILDVIYFSLWDYWPLLLVLVGIRIAWRGVVGESRQAASESVSTVNAVAVLGGVSRTCNAPDFRGGDMIAVMGGCEIDLRQARIAASPAVIDAFALWGGVDIRVPEDWVIIVKGVPFLGGYEDSTRPRPAEPSDPSLPTAGQVLIVKGFAIMGGVEVKN